jgi:hypothetical protein
MSKVGAHLGTVCRSGGRGHGSFEAAPTGETAVGRTLPTPKKKRHVEANIHSKKNFHGGKKQLRQNFFLVFSFHSEKVKKE